MTYMMQLLHESVGVKDAAGQPAMTVVHRKQKTRHNNDRSKKVALRKRSRIVSGAAIDVGRCTSAKTPVGG